MDALDKLRQWLPTFPKWEEGNLLYVDFTDGLPGCLGLFPKGEQILNKREDVLGRVTLRCRYHFALYRVVCGQEDQQENTRWLMEFQEWVRQQDALGLAPRFGDLPDEHIQAQKGQLSSRKQGGSTVYTVLLTADFTKIYEVN